MAGAVAAVLAFTPLVPASAADEGGAAERARSLSYDPLMKMPFEVRFELVEKLSKVERDEFLATLPREQLAVLLVDPDDCGAVPKFKRMAWVKGEPGGGVVSDAAQDVGQSLAKGVLNAAVPGLGGLGNALGTAARLNELNKLREYRDVCDMPPDEKTALLSGEATPPPKKENSFLDKASRFFSR